MSRKAVWPRKGIVGRTVASTFRGFTCPKNLSWIRLGAQRPNTPVPMPLGQQLRAQLLYTHTQAAARRTGILQCPGSHVAPERCCWARHDLSLRGSTCPNVFIFDPLRGPSPKHPRNYPFWATTFDSSTEHTHPSTGTGYWKFTMSRKPS